MNNGPLAVLIAVAGLLVAGGAAYPRFKRLLAADRAEWATAAHTDAELTQLLQDRRPGWRYSAFASVLARRRTAAASRLRDARTGFVVPGGRMIATDREAGRFFAEQLSELSDDIEQVDGFMRSGEFRSVFGNPDEENSVDADEVVHAANRLMDYHDRLLTLSERCRGVGVPRDCRDLQRDVAGLVLLPLEGFQSFIETFVGRVDEMSDPARHATADIQLDPVHIGVDDDDELMARVSTRLREVSRGA